MADENPHRKLKNSRSLYVWPAKHLSDAIRADAKETGKTLTRLVEESLADRYGLSVDAATVTRGKSPTHNNSSTEAR